MRPMILHADVDAFYASVAQRDDPRLRGRPVVVGTWVVMAASYEARAFGVRGGMATTVARRLCPDLIVASPSWPSYVEASRAVFAIFERFAETVEPASMEEAFLDVTDAGAAGTELAEELRSEVRRHTALPLSTGVARTRVLAKMASCAAKPDGCLLVAPERELEFLHPLPVARMWGVGPATAGRLHARGLRTVGQVASLSEADLTTLLGKAPGRYVFAVSRNLEQRPVRRRPGRSSFGAQRALGRGPHPPEDLRKCLAELAERVTKRMRMRQRAGRTVVLRLRFGDYTRATRSSTLPGHTADADAVAAACEELLEAAMPVVERRGLTLLGLTVTNLTEPMRPEQLTLPLPATSPRIRASDARDG